PEGRARQSKIGKTIRSEEEAFNKTLDEGLTMFDRAMRFDIKMTKAGVPRDIRPNRIQTLRHVRLSTGSDGIDGAGARSDCRCCWIREIDGGAARARTQGSEKGGNQYRRRRAEGRADEISRLRLPRSGRRH